MSDEIKKEEQITDATFNDERVIYELGYHLVSSIGEEQVPEKVSQIKALIEKHGGVFIMEEFPKMMRLAYTLVRGVGGKREKHDTAYFGWVKFELPRGVIEDVKKDLDADENILRFIIIRTVREDTRVGKHIVTERTESKDSAKVTHAPRKEEVKKEVKAPAPEVVSKDELDRTIDELVVE